MKRFNLDELIWFVILVLLTSLLTYLVKSNIINNFVNEDMLIYFKISIGILIIFLIAQFNKIFTIRSRNDITMKFIPLVFVIGVCVIFLFVLPAYRALEIKNIDDKLSYTNPNMIIINNENHMLLEEIQGDYLKFENTPIEFIGYVYEFSTFSDEIILARDEISCCQQDKRAIKVRVKGIGQNFKKGQWIKVVGNVKYDGTWYLELIDYKITRQPKDLYFNQIS